MTLPETVLAHTVIAVPPLCPELRLRLMTEACPLWRASEEELSRLGLAWPWWAFAWAGGQVLARYLLDHPEVVRGREVLDFGSGGGVEAVAAAVAGARTVIAADVDPLAAAAVQLNATLNGVTITPRTGDLIGRDERWDVVLAGDVLYGSELAGRIVPWLEGLARRGATVLVGDPHRGFWKPGTARLLAEYDAPADTEPHGAPQRRAAVWALLAAPSGP